MSWEPGPGVVELPDGTRVRGRSHRAGAPPGPAPAVGAMPRLEGAGRATLATAVASLARLLAAARSPGGEVGVRGCSSPRPGRPSSRALLPRGQGPHGHGAGVHRPTRRRGGERGHGVGSRALPPTRRRDSVAATLRQALHGCVTTVTHRPRPSREVWLASQSTRFGRTLGCRRPWTSSPDCSSAGACWCSAFGWCCSWPPLPSRRAKPSTSRAADSRCRDRSPRSWIATSSASREPSARAWPWSWPSARARERRGVRAEIERVEAIAARLPHAAVKPAAAARAAKRGGRCFDHDRSAHGGRGTGRAGRPGRGLPRAS